MMVVYKTFLVYRVKGAIVPASVIVLILHDACGQLQSQIAKLHSIKASARPYQQAGDVSLDIDDLGVVRWRVANCDGSGRTVRLI